MDFELLTGSYKRYKADTNAVVTWLSETATACGYHQASEPASQSPAVDTDPTPSAPLTLGERLREKAAKKAFKREEKNGNSASNPSTPITPTKKTTTRELLIQAQLIAKNPKVGIPRTIIEVIERAVEARKRCADWFRATKVKDERSNNSHRHFIGVLEQIIAILAPKKKDMPKESVSNVVPSVVGVENRFQTLVVDDVEDLPQDSEDASTSNGTGQESIPPAGNVPDPEELDLQEENEMSFAAWCFYEDMHRIQDFIKETWHMYQRQEIDLASASFVTSAAIETVRQEEVEISEMLSPGRDLGYILTVELLHSPKKSSLNPTEDQKVRAIGLAMTDFTNTGYDAFVYHGTARTIMKCMLGWKVEATQGVLSVYYVHNELPDIVNPGTENAMDPNRLLTQMIVEVIMDSELTQDMMNDMANLTGEQRENSQGVTSDDTLLKRMFPTISPSFIPESFMNAIHEMLHGRILSTYLVFASQVLLDIHAILGDKASDCYTELTAAVNRTRENAKMVVEVDEMELKGNENVSIRYKGELFPQGKRGHAIFSDFAASITTASSPRWDGFKNMYRNSIRRGDEFNATQWDTMSPSERRVKWDIHTRIPDDQNWLFLLPGTEAMEWMASQSMNSKISHEPFFYVRHNPINCGSKMLELLVRTENAGTCVANYHKSIWMVAHLYNAIRQLGILETAWPELDRLIELQKTLLFRGKLPENEEQFVTRLAMGCGIKLSELWSNNRLGRSMEALPIPSKKVSEFTDSNKLPCTKTSDILRMLGETGDNRATMEQCLHRINLLIQDFLKTKKRENAQLTSLQFLHRLRDWFPDRIRDIQIDYIGLNRMCTNLLKRIRLTLLLELKINHEVLNIANSQDPEPGHYMMVFRILQNAHWYREFQRRKSKKSRKKGAASSSLDNGEEEEDISSSDMMVVGKVFRKFLGDLEKGGELK